MAFATAWDRKMMIFFFFWLFQLNIFVVSGVPTTAVVAAIADVIFLTLGLKIIPYLKNIRFIILFLFFRFTDTKEKKETSVLLIYCRRWYHVRRSKMTFFQLRISFDPSLPVITHFWRVQYYESLRHSSVSNFSLLTLMHFSDSPGVIYLRHLV